MPIQLAQSLFLLMFGFALACGASDRMSDARLSEKSEGKEMSDDMVRRPGEPDVVGFSSGDPEMDEAMNRARDSLTGFFSEILKRQGDDSSFSLKIRIPTGDGGEHVWVSDPHLTGDRVSGILANEPLEGGLRSGDPVEASVNQVSDWMAILDGKLFGGFTIFVVRDRMSPADREAFDSSLDYEIPDSPVTF